MTGEVLIRVRNVSKSYRIVKKDPSEHEGKVHRFRRKEYETYTVFHDLDLEVCRGEVIGIVGNNGCGKSTFLKLISGILRPDTGTVQTKGKIVGILELSMGFHPDLSGYDNIFLRSELYGIGREEVEKNIDAIVRYADIGDYIHNPVRTYSSGMRSRLAFAVMINVDADVYLIDEALSTGDAKFASKASEHLKNLVRKGKTILLVSHSTGVIENTCDRAIWLCDHTIRMDGPADTVCSEYNRSLFDDIEDIRQLAEDGSSSAQYRLACCYRDGDRTEKDPAEYRRWLEEASIRGHTLAMTEYADLLVDEDPEGNREKAAELYMNAADNGNYEARRKYSALVSDGYADLPELIGFYRHQAESGDPADMYDLGNILFRTAMSAEGYAEAAQCFALAADGGNADAMSQLGLMYRDGTGVPKDVERAVGLLEKATDAGDTKAPVALFMLYDEGKLVPRDTEKAFRYALASAGMGNARSQYAVAVMYRDGTGTERNPEEARKWFSRYAGSLLSDFRLDAAQKIVRDRVECDLSADRLISAAAECGNYKAVRMMERRKAAEVGSVRVDEENLEQQKALADGGNVLAMYHVALFYKDSEDPQDREEYRRYMRMAADNGHRNAIAMVHRWESRNSRRRSVPQKEEESPEVSRTSEEQYHLAMEFKEKNEPGCMNEYRRLMRLAAEGGQPDAVRLVAKWDRKQAKASRKE